MIRFMRTITHCNTQKKYNAWVTMFSGNFISVRFVLFLAFMLLNNAVGAIDTLYTYFPDGKKESAIPYSGTYPEGVAIYFYPNGNIKEERQFLAGKVEGTVKLYDSTGVLRELYTIKNGKREGPASIFDSTGNFISDFYYENGKISKDFYASDELTEILTDENTLPPDMDEIEEPNHPNQEIPKTSEVKKPSAPVFNENDTIFFDLSSPDSALASFLNPYPSPELGWDNFYEKLSYPSFAKNEGITGVVKIKALVDKNGYVKQTEIVNELSGCEYSAEISVYFTKFLPITINGIPYTSLYIIPVEFK